MTPPVLQPVNLVHIIWNQQTFLFFGGYDYHRLSQHPAVEQAVKETVDRYGINCGGSRVTTGNHPLHIQLENKITEFLRTEDTALLPTGYMANLALFEVLADKDIICYYHPQCHPSLKTAIKTSGLPSYKIPSDIVELDELIKANGKKPCLITDGTYTELPPLQDYADLVEKYNGALVVDEAHTLGILGEHGRGAVEHFHISKKHLLITGSLSKGVGVSGGFVSGLSGCVASVRTTSAYATTSAMPLPIAAAASAAIDHILAHPDMIREFQDRCLAVKQHLSDWGYDVPVIPTPVISLCIEDPAQADTLKNLLIKSEIYPSLIRYPEKADYFRFALSSKHSADDIDKLLKVLKEFKKIG